MEALVLFTTMSVVGLIFLIVLLWQEHQQKKQRRDKTS